MVSDSIITYGFLELNSILVSSPGSATQSDSQCDAEVFPGLPWRQERQLKDLEADIECAKDVYGEFLVIVLSFYELIAE